MVNYENSKIYQVVCGETKRIYIGATTNTLCNRFHHHRHPLNPTRTKDFINPTIHLIEEYPCLNNTELSLKEKEWILKTNCVNVKIPLRTPAEYYRDNKLQISQQKKQYYQNNKEKIKLKMKDYYHNKIKLKNNKSP